METPRLPQLYPFTSRQVPLGFFNPNCQKPSFPASSLHSIPSRSNSCLTTSLTICFLVTELVVIQKGAPSNGDNGGGERFGPVGIQLAFHLDDASSSLRWPVGSSFGSFSGHFVQSWMTSMTCLTYLTCAGLRFCNETAKNVKEQISRLTVFHSTLCSLPDHGPIIS